MDSEDRYLNYFRRFLCYSTRCWYFGGIGAPDYDQAVGISPSNYINGVRLRPDLDISESVLQEKGYLPVGVSIKDFLAANVLVANAPTTSVSTVNVSTVNVPSTQQRLYLRHRRALGNESDDDDNNDNITANTNDNSDDDSDNDDNNDTSSEGTEDTQITTPVPEYEEIDWTKDARELYPWQLSTSKAIWILLQALDDERSGADKATKLQRLRGFLAACIFEPISGSVFHNPIVHFTAVLGIDEENRRLKEAVNFS